MSRPVGRRQLTLGEHFFWTVVACVAVCLIVGVLAFVST